ncbi:MAG: exodeoxyribonuclease VII small subunit [Candidatus Kapaibacteriota bacterium]|jgi:exodeoxyribonuclease VII small subunit
MAKKTAPLSIEDHLKRLQEIATILDRGDVPLEEQLQLFAEGMDLAATARTYLERAELRIQELSGPLTAQPDHDSDL